jgi:3-hydroxyisobutyrate dehydrogenase
LSEGPSKPIRADAPIGFIGLGQMGLPMARRLVAAGFDVRATDLSETARAAFAQTGGKAFASSIDAVGGVSALITMLPNGRIVREALLGDAGCAGVLGPDTLVIDMSSSSPMETRSLAEALATRNVTLIDAPVSGGVKRAIDGTLAIMAGGPAAAIERARPLFGAVGRSVFCTGPVGSGHAMKALNNYVSAAGLVAAAEAVAIGKTFGLLPDTIVDILNASSGRNNSTETKLKQFILSQTYASGFSLALMAKDVRTAADLADQLGVEVSSIGATAKVWEQADAALGPGADHTEIYRYLASLKPAYAEPGGDKKP